MPFNKQPKVDRTTRDWKSIVNDFVRPGGYLEGRFGSEYTEFRDTEFGAALIELIAGIGDTFNYTVDKEANESNLITAREIQNVIEGAAALGYIPRGARASRTTVSISTPGYTLPLTFQAGTVLVTDPTYGEIQYFELESLVNKPGNVSSVNATVIAGRSIQDPMVTSAGNGVKITLAEADVIFESDKVRVDGEYWTRVETFVDSTPSDKHYRILVSEEVPGTRKTLVEFGDGVTGIYPPPGSQIVIQYRVGGGSRSNVPAGAINRLDDSVYDVNGTQVLTLVSNPVAASMGDDQEDIDEIRINSGSVIRMNSRLVNNEDYEDAARSCGALRARCITNNEFPPVPENTLLILVCIADMDNPTSVSEADVLRTAILTKHPSRDTRRLAVVPCQLESVIRTLDIYLEKNASQADVDALVFSALTDFYSASSIQGSPPRYVVDIGRSLRMSDIIRIISQIPGVSYVDTDLEDFVPNIFGLPSIVLADWTFNYHLDVTDV